MSNLSEFCTCISKADSSDEFVGIRYENGAPKIHFPLGYFQNDEAFLQMSEDNLREHILNLFAILGDDSLANENSNSTLSQLLQDESDVRFPMRAYLSVLQNYLDYGYYTERETEYRQGASGKINWGRTIKITRPMITEDEQNVIYLNPISKHINYNENELISQVHKFCVHDASKRIGFLFGIEIQEEPTLDFDYELFHSVLESKLSKTFNDRNLTLFSDLQKIVEYLGNKNVQDSDKADDFYYGVNTFAPIWEAMLNKIFENLKEKEDKSTFNPHCRWDIENATPGYENTTYAMRPDTIMRNGEDVFVLDAKFYKYGITQHLNDLPSSGSICKQIAYAEFIEKNLGINGQHIYNAFLLPYCNNDSADSYKIKFIGTAYGDWKFKSKKEPNFRPYYKIAGFLVDVKSVMLNFSQNLSAQETLAKAIRGCI